MPRHQSPGQKQTIERVMHEFKQGELERGRGGKVRSQKQAIAIALHEAGASKDQSPAENRRNLARTKRRERRSATAEAGGATRAELYAEARRRKISGRSKMTKSELARALRG